MTTIDFKDYKETKKIKLIVQELTDLERLLTLVLKGLTVYKKYTPVKDILSSVLDNKALINIYLKKYKEVLEAKTNGKNKLENVS